MFIHLGIEVTNCAVQVFLIQCLILVSKFFHSSFLPTLAFRFKGMRAEHLPRAVAGVGQRSFERGIAYLLPAYSTELLYPFTVLYVLYIAP
jgi:hypothetical protein